MEASDRRESSGDTFAQLLAVCDESMRSDLMRVATLIGPTDPIWSAILVDVWAWHRTSQRIDAGHAAVLAAIERRVPQVNDPQHVAQQTDAYAAALRAIDQRLSQIEAGARLRKPVSSPDRLVDARISWRNASIGLVLFALLISAVGTYTYGTGRRSGRIEQSHIDMSLARHNPNWWRPPGVKRGASR